MMNELVVLGERTGPGMWHVHRGAGQLWILGSISPLPKGITWRSTQVEQILDSTNQVLVPRPFEISIPRIVWLLVTEPDLLVVRGGKRLKDVTEADLYARFALQRAKLTDDPKKWERYRPIIATAFLQQAAFHQAGLYMRVDLGASLRVLAKRHHVRVEEIKIPGVSDALEALNTIPPETANTCVEASLVTIERDLPRLADRAQAWATGDVERLESLPEPAEVDACRAALGAVAGSANLITVMKQTWLSTIEMHLQGDGVTVAVVDMDMLLEHGGLIDELRTKGYEVDSP
jgi:uncharacterized protein YbaP (TraB family)